MKTTVHVIDELACAGGIRAAEEFLAERRAGKCTLTIAECLAKHEKKFAAKRKSDGLSPARAVAYFRDGFLAVIEAHITELEGATE
ncbi:hypothetical protein [Cupriavidus basilensis]